MKNIIENIAIGTSVEPETGEIVLGSADETGWDKLSDLTTVRVSVPGIVDRIKAYTFFGFCHLKRVDIAEGVSRIGASAFRECGELTDVFLPESVTRIGTSAFAGCPNLTIHAPAGSYAERYARKSGIPVRTRKAARKTSASKARKADRAAT